MKKSSKILIIFLIVFVLLIVAYYLFMGNLTFFLSLFNGDVKIERVYKNDQELALIEKAEQLSCPGELDSCVNLKEVEQYQKEAKKINKGFRGYADLFYTARVTHAWPQQIQARTNPQIIKPGDPYYDATGNKITEADCRLKLGENYSTVELLLEYDHYCGNLCGDGFDSVRWVLFDSKENFTCQVLSIGLSWIS